MNILHPYFTYVNQFTPLYVKNERRDIIPENSTNDTADAVEGKEMEYGRNYP